MDNVTHALAGCLLAQATVAWVEQRSDRVPSGFGKAATVIGIVTAELPDADLLYAGPLMGPGKLGYLLHHRGHTHTVVFAIAAAVVVWWIALRFRPELRMPRVQSALLALALAGTLSHLLLDFSNSYGVHPFWPLHDAWYYGDAVFIVEPWLWVAALPPLFYLTRGVGTRVLFAAALLAILAAAWFVSMVERDVAIALTVGALLWLVVVHVAASKRRVAYGLTAWLVVELVFFSASFAARRELRAVTGSTLRDAELTPEVGNPFCFQSLVVEQDGATYRVTSAAVAPFSALGSAGRCRAPASTPQGDNASATAAPSRESTRAIVWGSSWSAPAADLAELAQTNCDVAAALRFIRVPVWHRLAGDSVRIADLRFGEGGFAALVAASQPAGCPRHVPSWTPPRSDVLALRP